MRTDSEEKSGNSEDKAVTSQSGNFLLLKLLFLVVGIPLFVPLSAVALQAILWRYVLSRVDGIGFAGGLWEAFALSLALSVFACAINMFAAVLFDQVRK